MKTIIRFTITMLFLLFFLSCAGQNLLEKTMANMVLVEAGGFSMGSEDDEKTTLGFCPEKPVHPVSITRDFYMSTYEVTFEEYDLFVSAENRKKPDDRKWGRKKQPAIFVNWYDAVDYCNWLSKKCKLEPCYSGTGKDIICNFRNDGFRLPTEAEWEYAARGGKLTNGFTYSGSNNADEVAWFGDNARSKAHPVGQKKPNELGIYDMSGNIWEWCWDRYDADFYSISPPNDPAGSPAGNERIFRGGGWNYDMRSLRVSCRLKQKPEYQNYYYGFRIARSVAK